MYTLYTCTEYSMRVLYVYPVHLYREYFIQYLFGCSYCCILVQRTVWVLYNVYLTPVQSTKWGVVYLYTFTEYSMRVLYIQYTCTEYSMWMLYTLYTCTEHIQDDAGVSVLGTKISTRHFLQHKAYFSHAMRRMLLYLRDSSLLVLCNLRLYSGF